MKQVSTKVSSAVVRTALTDKGEDERTLVKELTSIGICAAAVGYNGGFFAFAGQAIYDWGDSYPGKY